VHLATNPFADPALTVALALAAGVFAQAIARHLRIPGIVLLLGAGVLLGPDLLDAVRPASLGPTTLQALVGFAVAVVLFEGGLNLDVRRLRREARSIRQLVTLGAVVTAVGGAVAAHGLLGWSWELSALFGSLVIVTGPTVITPLLRRIRLKRGVSTVLEAEGVLIDAIGAVIAVVTLEVVLRPSSDTFSQGVLELLTRLGVGAILGAVAGALMALLLRHEHWVPEGLGNIFALSTALALFQGANALLPETGIVAVTAAGITLGNLPTPRIADLKDFKEQLTVLLIGMLFVLLAADVRLAQIRDLGWPGVATVLALMWVVRPLNVLVGTAGSKLTWPERGFLAWLAPRGIVAAAVSSLFAQRLDASGIEGGAELRALVFLVIAATVLIQGLSGGFVARLLGVWRPTNYGWAVLGANHVGLALAEVLREGGEEIVLIDSNPDNCNEAERRGFRVLYGNALAERLLRRAELETRAGHVSVTPSEEVNFLIARRARAEYKVPRAWTAMSSGGNLDELTRVTEKMLEKDQIRVLFGLPCHLSRWISRLERGTARLERWHLAGDPQESRDISPEKAFEDALLLLATKRGKAVQPYGGSALKGRDMVVVLIAEKQRDEANRWLAGHGFSREPATESGASLTFSPTVAPESEHQYAASSWRLEAELR